MTAVLGFDPSSKLLVAVIDTGDEALTHWVKHLPDPESLDKKAWWAFHHCRRLTSRLTRDHGDVYAFVEEPVVGRGGAHTTIVQATVRGGIVAGLREGGVKEIHGVNNQRWKKAVIGNGGADKDRIRAYVRQTWPEWFDSVVMNHDLKDERQDLCDARCILENGRQVVSMGERIAAHKLREQKRRKLK